MYSKQQIEIGNRKFKPGRGVSQGGVLSPLLFNVYLEDTLMNNPILNAAIKADKLIAFADDLLLITDSKVEMEGLLKQIESLGNESLILNQKKTVILSDIKDVKVGASFSKMKKLISKVMK